MAQKIVVPFDGSEPSETALEYACEQYPDAEITAYYVAEIQDQMERYVPQAQGERADEAKEVLEGAMAIAGERDIETDSGVGKPDQAILDFVDDEDMDLIVMGSHGRTGVNRLILGSVAERVIRNATVPVLVMP